MEKMGNEELRTGRIGIEERIEDILNAWGFIWCGGKSTVR
jgi:hypothetical protein